MDIRTEFYYRGEYGLMTSLVAYGHTEFDSGHVYAVLDRVADSFGYVVTPPEDSTLYATASAAIDYAAQKRAESLHHSGEY